MRAKQITAIFTRDNAIVQASSRVELKMLQKLYNVTGVRKLVDSAAHGLIRIGSRKLIMYGILVSGDFAHTLSPHHLATDSQLTKVCNQVQSCTP